MKKFITALSFLLSTLPALAQEAQNQTIELDFSKECIKLTKSEPELDGLNCNSIPPFEIVQKDRDDKEWKVRFHFGFSRTQYLKTDLNFDSTAIKVEVKGIEMQERARGYHYDVTKWEDMRDATSWIDEPTNTMMLSFEKDKNNFYLTVFHPKFLRSIYYKTNSETGENYDFRPVDGYNNYHPEIPEGSNMLYIQNSHLNLIAQVGYGRQFKVFGSKKFGSVTYIPKADIGVNYSKARSINFVEGKEWDLHEHKTGINGVSASIGHRLEYQKGVFALFIDQKFTYSKMNQGFLDGSVNYNLVSSPVTFGVAIDLFSKKKKRK
jgi:hypothetical protein